MKTCSLYHRYSPILFLCSVLLLGACKKNNDAPPSSAPQERLVFKDVKDFYQTLDQLDKMSPEKKEQWEKDHQHYSFRKFIASLNKGATLSKSQENLLSLPTSYQILLNEEGEIQVGDTIVWYNQGSKYYVAANDAAALQKIKKNPSLAVSTTKYSVTPIVKLGTPRTETIGFGLNDLNANYQKEFYAQAPAAGCRKYVHELKSFLDGWQEYNDPFCGYIVTYYSRLYMSLKLEWKTCSRTSWNPAGEARTLRWTLNKNIYLRGVRPPCGTVQANIPFTGTEQSSTGNATSNVDILLASHGGNSSSDDIYWEVSLSGSIYHHVNGDIQSNEWNHIGQPFF
jgi:hypothetical protein